MMERVVERAGGESWVAIDALRVVHGINGADGLRWKLMMMMKLSMGAGWRCEVVVRSAVRRFGERLGKSEVEGLRPQLACSPNRPGCQELAGMGMVGMA